MLTYHRVLEEYDELVDDLHAVQFLQQMKTLSQYFNVMTLDEGLSQVRTGKVAPGAVCITFDDGYRDNHDVALPILKELGLSATFFISTGYLGGGMMWNDIVVESVRKTQIPELDLTGLSLGKYNVKTTQQKKDLINVLIHNWRNKSLDQRNNLASQLQSIARVNVNERIMMTEAEVKELSSCGMEIGGHTVNHPILTSATVDEAAREVKDGKAQLEKITGKKLKYFAYPSGRAGLDYQQVHMDVVKQAGFIAALTTNDGAIDQHANPYELPRISVDYTNKFKFGASVARGYMQYAN